MTKGGSAYDARFLLLGGTFRLEKSNVCPVTYVSGAEQFQAAGPTFSIHVLLARSIRSGRTGRGAPIDADDLVNNGDLTTITLTEREIEVLRLILEGKSSKEVAASLCCSKRTVDFHLARVYQKLDVSNRVQAMRRCAVLGLIPIAPEGRGEEHRG